MMKFKQFKKQDVALYLDMDGVFADFIKGAAAIFENFDEICGVYSDSAMTPRQKYLRTLFVEDIKNTPNFWLNLEWEPGGQDLFKFVKENFNTSNMAVLTAPVDQDMERCVAEKWLWCQSRFEGLINEEHFFVDHDKHHYVGKLPGKHQILIDDRIDNIRLWEQQGGIGILHDSNHYTLSIESLQKFI